MVIRFTYALHVETGLVHVWPSKGARNHDIGFESDCSRYGWRPLPSWEARPLMGSLTGETRMAFMVGAWAGSTRNACTARSANWSRRRPRCRPVPDVAPGDAYRRTHARERRPDGKNRRNIR